MLKIFITFVLFYQVFCFSYIKPEGGYPYPEPPCNQVGGSCMQAVDCPVGKEAEKGLCPEQERYDVQCCYSMPLSETRCRQNGGECLSTRCPENLVFSRATDCEDDQKCCILV